MPCYQERMTTVDLVVADKQLLEAALGKIARPIYKSDWDGCWYITSNDWSKEVIYNPNTGTVRARESSLPFVDNIKRAYSHEVVRAQAKRFGWQVTADEKDENRLHLGRRSF